MTLVNDHSTSCSDSYDIDYSYTIDKVVIPKEKLINNKIKNFALTKVGKYSVSTIRKSDNWYETQIWCNSHEDSEKIGYYVKKSNNSKLALNQHIEAIWHIHHSCREGL